MKTNNTLELYIEVFEENNRKQENKNVERVINRDYRIISFPNEITIYEDISEHKCYDDTIKEC